jgi:hypothetical protein
MDSASTYHDDGEPGLLNAGTANGVAVEEVDVLTAAGESRGSRGGEDALSGEESRSSKGLETDHFVCYFCCRGRGEMESRAGVAR